MRERTVTLDELRASKSAVITRTEAAAALGVDPRTVTASIENGSIPSVRLGRRVVIPRERFLRLFDAEPTPSAPAATSAPGTGMRA